MAEANSIDNELLLEKKNRETTFENFLFMFGGSIERDVILAVLENKNWDVNGAADDLMQIQSTIDDMPKIKLKPEKTSLPVSDPSENACQASSTTNEPTYTFSKSWTGQESISKSEINNNSNNDYDSDIRDTDSDADVIIEEEKEVILKDECTSNSLDYSSLIRSLQDGSLTFVDSKSLPTRQENRKVQGNRTESGRYKVPQMVSKKDKSKQNEKSQLRNIFLLNYRQAKSIKDTFQRIYTLAVNGVKVLILLRGVPGSGKSHTASLLINELNNSKAFGKMQYNRHIYSTDDYFIYRSEYSFDPSKLQDAHAWNQKRVNNAVKKEISPIVIDNTNVQLWEMKPYVLAAVPFGYHIEILEPNTPWKLNENVLFERNIHNVPKHKIRMMLDRFEDHNITSDNLLRLLNVKYSPSCLPPQPLPNIGINVVKMLEQAEAVKKRVRRRRKKSDCLRPTSKDPMLVSTCENEEVESKSSKESDINASSSACNYFDDDVDFPDDFLDDMFDNFNEDTSIPTYDNKQVSVTDSVGNSNSKEPDINASSSDSSDRRINSKLDNFLKDVFNDLRDRSLFSSNNGTQGSVHNSISNKVNTQLPNINKKNSEICDISTKTTSTESMFPDVTMCDTFMENFEISKLIKNDFDRVRKLILNKVKVLVLLRGCSGSGKTYTAKKLIEEVNKSKHGLQSTPSILYDQCIFSADDYFTSVETGYNFDQHKLFDALLLNQTRAEEAMKNGGSPVIVDSCNVEVFEMKPYIKMAVKYGYYIELLEPDTEWKLNEQELTVRNIHSVSRIKIRYMLDKFQRDVTANDLLITFGLTYPPDKKPPLMVSNDVLTLSDCSVGHQLNENVNLLVTAAKPDAADLSVEETKVAGAESSLNAEQSIDEDFYMNLRTIEESVFSHSNVDTDSVQSGKKYIPILNTIMNEIKNTFERILILVLCNVNVLVFMRGIYGSGKSYMAKFFIDKLNEIKHCDPPMKHSEHIFNDCINVLFYLKNESFFQNLNKHLDVVEKSMRERKTPIIIDNCNIVIDEMTEYAKMAYRYGYVVEILEPDTNWKYDIDELWRRNSVRFTSSSLLIPHYINKCEIGTYQLSKKELDFIMSLFDKAFDRRKLIAALDLQYNHDLIPVIDDKELYKAALKTVYTQLNDDPEWYFSKETATSIPSDPSLLKDVVYNGPDVSSRKEGEINIETKPDLQIKQNTSALNDDSSKSQTFCGINDDLNGNTHTLTESSDSSVNSPEKIDTPNKPSLADIITSKRSLEKVNIMDFIINNDVSTCCDERTVSSGEEKEDSWKSWEESSVKTTKTLNEDSPKPARIHMERLRRIDLKNNIFVASETDIQCKTRKEFLDWSTVPDHSSDWFAQVKETISGTSKEQIGPKPQRKRSFEKAAVNVKEIEKCSDSNEDNNLVKDETSANGSIDVSKCINLLRTDKTQDSKESCCNNSEASDNEEIKYVTADLSNQLANLFPNIKLSFLNELVEKCDGDINWVAEILCEEECNEQVEFDDVSLDREFGLTRSEDGENMQHSGLESNINRKPVKKLFVAKGKLSKKAAELKKTIEKCIVLNASNYSDNILKVINRKKQYGYLEEPCDLKEAEVEQNFIAVSIKDPTVIDSINQNSKDTLVNEAKVDETFPAQPRLYPNLDEMLTLNDETSDECAIEVSDSNKQENISPKSDTADSNDLTELKEDDEDTLEFIFSNDFITTLHGNFGNLALPESMLGKDRVVKLPKSLARQIHSYVMDSFQREMDNEDDILQKMIAEDEEYARNLQEMENQAGLLSNKQPSLDEIIDMEKALALYEAEKDYISKENTETFAAKLSQKILMEKFPGIDPQAINNVYKANNFSLQDTIATLLISQDNVTTLSDWETQLHEKAKEEYKKVREQGAVAVVDSERDSVHLAFDDFEYYREKAQRLQNEFVACLEKAKEAFNLGNKHAASYYSQLASLHKKQMEIANTHAATALLNAHESTNNITLDLHFFQVREAIQVLDIFLDSAICRLRESQQIGTLLYVITGRGNHSQNGRARLKPVVMRRLTTRRLKFTPLNPGMLEVTVVRSALLSTNF